MDLAIRLIIFLVIFTVIFAVEWRRLRARSAQNPDLTKATPWRDRWRIARAVRQGERLNNPREARIAAGIAADQQSFNRWLRGVPQARLALGAVFTLLGLLAGSVALTLLGAFVLAIGLFETAHVNRLSRRLERAEKVNREQGSIGQ